MIILNLLEFLNSVKILTALEYAKVDNRLVNFLDLMSEDEQFTYRIDFGVMYLFCSTSEQYTIIDGLNRLLSLSLLLHAICECYKKTSQRNDKAIRTIRSKYLLNGTKTKLRLPKESQSIYEKIIYGERLSGIEKKHPMFILLHSFWSQIKEEKLQASNIFKMLQKIRVTVVDTEQIPYRDLYYNLNKDKRELNQPALIENYLKSNGIKDEWAALEAIYKGKKSDIELFFKDYFVTKFNFKEYDKKRLYEMFTNYFDTMMIYQSPKVIMENMLKDAKIYYDILNVNFENKKVKDAFIQIKMYGGEDTYAYLLGIYSDYLDGNLTEGTFLEIMSTITDYLKNRTNTPNDITFNELMRYLNAFISCK